jgi:hypothetical protein
LASITPILVAVCERFLDVLEDVITDFPADTGWVYPRFCGPRINVLIVPNMFKSTGEMACKFILKEERHYCVSECHFSCTALIAIDGSIREILTDLLQARKSRLKAMSSSAVRAYVEYSIDNFSPH